MSKVGYCKPGLEAHMSPTVGDIRQAAGIYEGEGWCAWTGTTQHVGVGQKDIWVLHWLRERFGGSVTFNGGKNHDFSMWRVTGSRARGFLMTIFQFLSPRRKDQIRKALAE